MRPNYSALATVVSVTDSQGTLALEYVHLLFTRYLWMVIVIVGIPGNILSIMVTLQKDNRRISTCVYMTALAFADTMVLIEAIWGHVVTFWRDQKPTEFEMQLQWFQAWAFGILSGFYLTEMTIDRLIAVRFPLAASRICTTRRAKITIVITFFFAMALNVYIFFTFKYVQEAGEEVIRMSVDDPSLETFGMLVPLLFGTVVPFLIIVICNIWIIKTLHEASKRRLEMMSVGQDGAGSKDKDTRYLTKMLIIVCIAYVFTSIPYRLHDLLLGVPAINQYYDLNVKYWKLRYSAQNYILHHLWEWNYAVNFYLYCIGGGRKYRKDVKERLRSVLACLGRQ